MNKIPLLPNLRFNGYNSTYPNNPKLVSLLTPNSNWRNRTANPNTAPIRKQLTQKELQEKKAMNLCLYCDKKYAPSYKCPRQMFSLEVIVDNDEEDIVWEAAKEDVDCELSDVLNVVQEEDSVPHISLNALTVRLSTEEYLPFASNCGKCMMSSNMCRIKWSFQGEEFVADMMILPLGGCEMVLVLNMVSATTTNDAPTGLQILLADYNDVFAIPKEIPPVKSHDHRIPLKEGSPTVNIRPYRHPATQEDAIESMAQELLDARQLNKHTIKDKFPIPFIEELIDELCDSRSHRNNEADQAFKQLKQAMMAGPVLKLLNFEEDFMVETDASGEGIGVVLQQQGHPLAYQSKALYPKHQLLSTYEKKFLVVLQALDKWRGYLLDRYFKIKIDHLSLIYLLDQRISTPTQMKWLPKLMGFDYEIKYKRGKDNAAVDALSRIQGNDNGSQHDLIEYFHAGTMGGHSGVKVTTHTDLAVSPILLQPLPIPQRVWFKVSMDFIDGLPTSKGKTVILAMVDRLSVCGERPKEWVHWLPLTEYWYNTNFHTSINATPFEVLYGQPPLPHVAYVQGDNNVDVVGRSMTVREDVISLLKFHLERSHVKIKNMAYKKRSEREFELNDWVYVKLQPYRKISMRKCRIISYNIRFMVLIKSLLELLKAHRGDNPNTQQALIEVNEDAMISDKPQAVLERKKVKKGEWEKGVGVEYVLVSSSWLHGKIANIEIYL
ncbi:retrotransposable element Tf2 [Tanacetum coccineum]